MFAIGFVIGALDRRPEPCWFFPSTPRGVRRTARVNAGYEGGRATARAFAAR